MGDGELKPKLNINLDTPSMYNVIVCERGGWGATAVMEPGQHPELKAFSVNCLLVIVEWGDLRVAETVKIAVEADEN